MGEFAEGFEGDLFFIGDADLVVVIALVLGVGVEGMAIAVGEDVIVQRSEVDAMAEGEFGDGEA